jgi:putative transcriptional regulator
MKNKIKVYRAMRDLTQEDLALSIGVTRQTIIAIEKGRYVPSLELAFKIARYFNAGVEEIFLYDVPAAKG